MPPVSCGATFKGIAEQSPLHMTSQDPPFDDADFAAVKGLTDRSHFLGSLGDRHFTVELPWDAGAMTRLLRHEHFRKSLRAKQGQGLSDDQLDRWAGATSLLQILMAEHPLYGKGIRSTLELPISPTDLKSAQLVNELNAWELSEDDLPPQFGAWCIGHRALSYVSFIPTQFCVPGILSNLAIWMVSRHARVREWQNASRSRH